jgi:NADPH:quinone reductase
MTNPACRRRRYRCATQERLVPLSDSATGGTPEHESHTMRYIDLTKPGPPENMRIAEGPAPTPGPDEVLIHVQAAGVNRPDIMQRQGRYPVPPDANPVLGLEVAGTITARGADTTSWNVGDNVAALVHGGGYAEYCTVHAGHCLPWPTGYTAVQAAALPETFFTVWVNLFIHGRLSAGETTLIHGGTSGIGTTAIALAQAFGANALATAGNAAKCEAIEKLGAWSIDYNATDFVAETYRLTNNQGVDVVLDMVAGPYLSRNMNVLRKDGRLVVIAVQGGISDPDFTILPVMHKRLTITGSTMRPRTIAEKAAIATDLHEKVWPKLNEGSCAPIIHATFPLEEVAKAHALMESGAHIGKIVLTL